MGYNGIMSFAPQHDWEGYAARTGAADAAWIRSLSLSERFAIYADMFDLAWEARQSNPALDWQALDEQRWQEKLALRMKLVEASRKMDENRFKAASNGNLPESDGTHPAP
jgi:hypothetical protein